MEVKAKVIQVFEPTKYTSRRDGSEQYIYNFLVETVEDNYPKKMYMQVFGTDRWTQFNIQVGLDYTLRFDVSSREYNTRWYTELTCFSAYAITADGNNNAASQPQAQSAPKPQAPTQPNIPTPAPASTSDNSDDLPF